jgi:hypothetical protein
MPIWNWNKIHETGDLKYLVIADNYKDIEEQNNEETADLWLDLYQQYIDEFGINDDFKRFMRKKQQLAAKLAEYIASGDRFKLNKIKVIEVDIKGMLNEKEPQKFGEVVAGVEKFFGFQIDSKVLTVQKYYNYIKYIEGNVKAHGQANKKQ